MAARMQRLARTAAPVILIALALSGCGRKAALEPLPGHMLPPAPYGSDVQPTAEELLELSPQARPERSIELRSESEEREDDPFDLPPEG